MTGSRVVETRSQDHAKAHFAFDRFGAAHQIVRVAHFLDGHEVRYLGDTVFAQEPRQQHIRVGQVKLLVGHFAHHGSELKPASFGVIQERGKNRR